MKMKFYIATFAYIIVILLVLVSTNSKEKSSEGSLYIASNKVELSSTEKALLKAKKEYLLLKNSKVELKNEYRLVSKNVKSEYINDNLKVNKAELLNHINIIKKAQELINKTKNESSLISRKIFHKLAKISHSLAKYLNKLRELQKSKSNKIKTLKFDAQFIGYMLSSKSKAKILNQINREIVSLKRINKIRVYIRRKLKSLSKKRSKLEILARTLQSKLKNKFNEYYDDVAKELGFEARNLRKTKSINTKSSKSTCKLNKRIDYLQLKVERNIRRVRSKRFKSKGYNRKLTFLANTQKELMHLIRQAAKLENNNTRDYRARTVKILRKYHRAQKMLNKNLHLKKNQVDLYKNYRKYNINSSKIDRLREELKHIQGDAQHLMSSPTVKEINKLKEKIIPENVKEIMAKRSLKGLEVIENKQDPEVEDIDKLSEQSKALASSRIEAKKTVGEKKRHIKKLKKENRNINRKLKKLSSIIGTKLDYFWNPYNYSFNKQH